MILRMVNPVFNTSIFILFKNYFLVLKTIFFLINRLFFRASTGKQRARVNIHHKFNDMVKKNTGFSSDTLDFFKGMSLFLHKK